MNIEEINEQIRILKDKKYELEKVISKEKYDTLVKEQLLKETWTLNYFSELTISISINKDKLNFSRIKELLPICDVHYQDDDDPVFSLNMAYEKFSSFISQNNIKLIYDVLKNEKQEIEEELKKLDEWIFLIETLNR